MIAGANLALFQALNGLVGQSWLLDSAIAAGLDNPVVKAGPIGACFLYAWHAGRSRLGDEARRRILAVTLLALFVIAPVSKLLSEGGIAPRPFVMAQETYVYRDGALAAPEPIAFRALQTGELSGRIKALREGELEGNDLGTFPSDHAALYFALALGILLASRAAGIVAMLWTFGVVFLTRVAAGLHWPVDILAGAAVGAAILLALQLAFARVGRRHWDAAMAWSARRPALASALLFLMLLEIVSTMPTMERGREIVSVLAERFA